MATIPASLRRLVIQRAENRCEYCRISQIGQVATFHIDHIVPVVADGETIAENLALACVSCSLRKGARQNLEDSKTGEVVSIFNPRQQACILCFLSILVKVIFLKNSQVFKDSSKHLLGIRATLLWFSPA